MNHFSVNSTVKGNALRALFPIKGNIRAIKSLKKEGKNIEIDTKSGLAILTTTGGAEMYMTRYALEKDGMPLKHVSLA